MNELCEEIFSHRAELLKDVNVRERVVAACQTFRYMSVGDIDKAFAEIPGFVPADVQSEARDLGRAMEPPSGQIVSSNRRASRGSVGGGQTVAQPKMTVFCLDWSPSMMSQDTGSKSRLNRFETCQKSIQGILRDQVLEHDMVSMIGFGNDVQTVLPPTQKQGQQKMIEQQISRLKASTVGGTCFFDAVLEALKLLSTSTLPSKWLVCLTDGDDVGSRKENALGQLVTQKLDSGAVKNLNMVIITVGSMKAENSRAIDTWVERVCKAGGDGRHVNEKDAAQIEMAFEVVAECLAADLGGAVEC